MRYSYWRLPFLLVLLSLSLNAQTTAHIDTAKKYLYVRELTGHNDGKQVEMFLKSVGRRKGDAWCSAFVSYCLTANNIKSPSIRSGLAREYVTKSPKNIVTSANKILYGLVIEKGSLVVWGYDNSINGHIGIVTNDTKGNRIETIEGNSSNGVYNRIRKIEPANYFRIKWFVKVR